MPTPSVHLTPPPGIVPCPTRHELDLVDSEIPIYFEDDASAGRLACLAADGSRDLTPIQKNAYETLLFMRRVSFDAPLPWTDKSLYEWFRGEVRGIRIRRDLQYSFCCQPAYVINLQVDRFCCDQQWMLDLRNGMPDDTIPPYLEVMVHEARHISGPGHSCGANDSTISQLGSFGVQYHLLRWLGEHWPEGTPAEREYALNRAAWLKTSAFCGECR
jgi:hypothetical protein